MTEGHGDPEIQMALLDTENMTETGIDLLLGELETCMKHPKWWTEEQVSKMTRLIGLLISERARMGLTTQHNYEEGIIG